jgi:hypothetical protein
VSRLKTLRMVIGQASVEGEENPMDAELLALLDLVEAQHRTVVVVGNCAGKHLTDCPECGEAHAKALRLYAELERLDRLPLSLEDMAINDVRFENQEDLEEIGQSWPNIKSRIAELKAEVVQMSDAWQAERTVAEMGERHIERLEAALRKLGDMSCSECGYCLNDAAGECADCAKMSAVYAAALADEKTDE